MNTLTIPRWVDRHLHLRDGAMLKTVLPHTLASQAAAAVIMGNLAHPDETSTVAKAVAYRERIMALMPFSSNFKPLMTCYLTDATSVEEMVRGFDEGVWCAAKLYLAGKAGTTNSGHGVSDIANCYGVFRIMEMKGIPLLGHFESVDPNVDEFDREIVAVENILVPLLEKFPGLKVVFEHVTDGRAAAFVAETGHDVRATVTAHHLILDRNAMFAGGLTADNYCKPVPKRKDHRQKLRRYATSGNPRFGAGTDSAPHDWSAKSRSTRCAAGIFNAPAAVELYAKVFEEERALPNFSPFMSENFVGFYGLAVSSETMTLERAPFRIPDFVEGVRVFKGGETLPWKLADR